MENNGWAEIEVRQWSVMARDYRVLRVRRVPCRIMPKTVLAQGDSYSRTGGGMRRSQSWSNIKYRLLRFWLDGQGPSGYREAKTEADL
jgi:hypothetical protein